jgi:hypothetical protein
MSNAINVTREWPVNPQLSVQADGDVIQLMVRLAGYEHKVSKGGLLGVDVSNTANLADAMIRAKQWNAAVFPPAGPGRRDLEFPAPARAKAWEAVTAAGITDPSERTITEFLRDWHCADNDDQRTIEQFAEQWREIRYAI